MKRIPRAQLILDYKSFFGIEAPSNRISIIKEISRKSILFEISALNYRLKPKDKLFVDESFETQIKELEYFSQSESLFEKYSRVVDKYYINKNDYPNIFNRQACLFAIEEIINSDEMEDIEDFDMARVEVWESIFKYLLSVNSAITHIKNEENEKGFDFEIYNSKLLPINELSIETNPIFTPYRGYWLLKYLVDNSIYSKEVDKYFKTTYELEPDQFIFELMKMYLTNESENGKFDFFFQPAVDSNKLFEILSIRIRNKEIHKLISIRKSPFIKIEREGYLIVDNALLLEKAYSQFLNDFWFDWIKNIKDDNGKSIYNINQFRSVFGYFFENYLSNIFKKSFKNYKYAKLLLFDELKVKSLKGWIEIADIYLRYGNKIFLGQAKSGSIYDAEKYSDTLELFYKNDRNKFFQNFGVDQLVESINLMNDYIQQLDPKFPKGHTYHVYPSIIVNDKAFQTPLMADVFNKRFSELVSKINIKKIHIAPLSLIHVHDLERTENSFNKKPEQLWDILKYNHNKRIFIAPFYNAVDIKLQDRAYSRDI